MSEREVQCEQCELCAERLFSFGNRRDRAQSFDPVVIHRGANGEIRFPGSSNAKVPEGFQRVELRTIEEVRRFETEVNAMERAKIQKHFENEERAFSEGRAARRAELRDAMKRMSPLGRALAMAAIQYNNSRTRRAPDPGFHVEVFNNDSSNREPHRDAVTGWRARRA